MDAAGSGAADGFQARAPTPRKTSSRGASGERHCRGGQRKGAARGPFVFSGGLCIPSSSGWRLRRPRRSRPLPRCGRRSPRKPSSSGRAPSRSEARLHPHHRLCTSSRLHTPVGRWGYSDSPPRARRRNASWGVCAPLRPASSGFARRSRGRRARSATGRPGGQRAPKALGWWRRPPRRRLRWSCARRMAAGAVGASVFSALVCGRARVPLARGPSLAHARLRDDGRE